MDPPSVSPCRGHVPWQGLLLAASLLTVGISPTMAKYTVEPAPPIAAEGTDMLLLLHSPPQNAVLYSWFKGETPNASLCIVTYTVQFSNVNPGPEYTDRHTIFPNGSLLLQNVTKNDTGNYTIGVMDASYIPEYVSAQLHVYQQLPKPHILSSHPQPVQPHSSVELTCEPELNDTTYLWWRHGQKLMQTTDRLKLTLENRTLALLHVTQDDAGPYECGISNPASATRSNTFTLNISSKENIVDLSSRTVMNIVIGVLIGVAVVSILGSCLLVPRIGGSSSQHDLTEFQSSASSPPPTTPPNS